jgi:hypothetical protein
VRACVLVWLLSDGVRGRGRASTACLIGCCRNAAAPVPASDPTHLTHMHAQHPHTHTPRPAGIIDILQQYNSFKRAETFFKSFKYDSRQISAVEPAWYARRFVDFCAQHVS